MLVIIPIMGRTVRAVSLMPEAWKLQDRNATTRLRRLTAWGDEAMVISLYNEFLRRKVKIAFLAMVIYAALC